MEEKQYSTKGRTTSLETKNYDETWSKCIMTMKWLDTQENWKPTTPYVNTIGGQDFEHSWRTVYKAVERANSLKSTDHCQTRLIKQ